MSFDTFAKQFGSGSKLIEASDFTIIEPPFVDAEGQTAQMAESSVLIPFTYIVSSQKERDKITLYVVDLWNEIHNKLETRAVELVPGIQVLASQVSHCDFALKLFCNDIMSGEPPYNSFLLQEGGEEELPETFVILRLAHSIAKDLKKNVVQLLSYVATEQWARLPGARYNQSKFIRKLKGSWEI